MKLKWLCVSLLVFLGGTIHSQNLEVTNLAYGARLKTSILESSYYQKGEKQNFGVSLFSDRFWKHFPCQLKAGNMNCGGLWSFVKSPVLEYSYSPFFTSRTGAQNMTSGLSGFNSFPEDITYFIQAGYENNKTAVTKANLNLWYNPKQQILVFSDLLKFKITKSSNLSISSLCSMLPYNSNISSTWYNSGSEFFHQGKMIAFGNQMSVIFPHNKLLLSAACYSTPEGSVKSLFRLDNQLLLKKFVFSSSVFYSPSLYINLPFDNVLQKTLSFRTGLNYRTRLPVEKPVMLKLGVNVFGKINFTKTEYPFKLTEGVQFTSDVFSGTVGLVTGLSVKNKIEYLEPSFESQKVRLDVKYNFEKVSAGLCCDITFYSFIPDFTLTQKYALSVESGKKLRKNGSLAWSQSIKQGSVSSSDITLSLNLSGTIGCVTVFGKTTIKYEL